MGAKHNNLFDLKMCRSICISGQCVLLILLHDIREIPTVRLVESNTDALEFEIDEDKLPLAKEVMKSWQKRYRLELEDDNILKLVMRDVNNFCEVLQTPYGKEVKFKGSVFASCPNIKIHEDGRLETIRNVSLKNNSMSVVGEAVLKKLLFDIPIEKTINNCNDIFLFQTISHLGSSYEKCVLKNDKEEITLQRNNRIYAGKIPTGIIYKVKADGRYDSLASQPINPIIDNGNKCTIDDINKEWYIELANQRVNDFLGIKRLEEYKKEELLQLASDCGLDIDKKTKKADLIEIIKKYRKEEKKMATKKEQEIEVIEITNDMVLDKRLYAKINEFRKGVRATGFVFDKELPNNLGGGEYYSIDQFYNAIQDICVNVGLDFSFETVELLQFDKELTKPSGKLPIHVATVKTIAKFTDIETGREKNYITIAQGSDTIDKAIASASSMAFRNWFYKNFTPKNMDEEEIDNIKTEKSEAPKVPVYVPEQRKEEIKKEVVKQEQHETSDGEDIKEICENIMKIREKINDPEYGAKTLEKIMSGVCTSTDLLEIDLKIKNKMEKVGL